MTETAVEEEFQIDVDWINEQAMVENLKDENAEKEEEEDELHCNTTYLQDILSDAKIDYCILFDDNDEEAVSSPTPFEKMISMMTDVSNNSRLLFKKVVSRGDGVPLPEQGIALYNFRYYFEGADEPFDSSYTVGGPQRHRLSSGVLVPGIDMALGSMSKGERAIFIIKSDLMFGEVGCEPRIPRSADVFADIQLVNIFAQGSDVEFFDKTREERRSLPFEDHLRVAVSCRKTGNEFCTLKKYASAARQYYKAIEILAYAPVRSDEEDRQRLDEELIAKRNLSQAASNLGKNRLAIKMCNDVLRFEPNDIKSIYRKGKALSALADFDEADKYFERALRLKPNESCILKAIEDNRVRRAMHLNMEKSIYQKMVS